MAFDPAFIQLLGTLSQMQQRRAELQLQTQQQELEQSKFSEFLKQAHDKDIADALNTLIKLQPQQQEAYLKLGQKFTPAEMASLQSVAAGLPPDLAAMNAHAVANGYASMDSGARGQLDQAAATRMFTQGMTPGQVGQSAFQGAAAQQALGNPQMVAGGAQMLATNQSPLDAAIQQGVMSQAGQIGQYQYGLQISPWQQAQNAVQRGGVQAEFYGHNVQAMIGAQQMALERLRLTAKEDPQKMMLQLMEFRAKALDAIENPKASPGGIQQRIEDMNTAAMMMNQPWLVITDQNDPDAPRKMGMIQQWLHAMPGFGNQVPTMPGRPNPVSPAPYNYMNPAAPSQMPPMSPDTFNPFAGVNASPYAGFSPGAVR